MFDIFYAVLNILHLLSIIEKIDIVIPVTSNVSMNALIKVVILKDLKCSYEKS